MVLFIKKELPWNKRKVFTSKQGASNAKEEVSGLFKEVNQILTMREWQHYNFLDGRGLSNMPRRTADIYQILAEALIE